MKASSNLTEADRIDVRAKIAAVADVSLGNVTKVKKLLITGDQAVLDALRSGEIRINRAWAWSKLSSDEQCSQLAQFRIDKGSGSAIKTLLARHRLCKTSSLIGLRHLRSGMLALKADPALSTLLERLHELLRDIDQLLTLEARKGHAH